MTLPIASALIYNAATGRVTEDVFLMDRVARVIAERTGILSRPLNGRTYHPVAPAVVAEGVFEEGGKRLSFSDHRDDLEDLAIRRSAVPRLLLELQEALKAL